MLDLLPPRPAGLFLILLYMAGTASADPLTPQQRLGKLLFFDTSLSTPPGQACASCHDPAHGFADPDHGLPVSRGVYPDRFGSRNAPTAAYAAFSPAFHFDKEEGLYVGGQFLDGRAATLEEQAKGPFVNPVEMANPDPAAVIAKLRAAEYRPLFEEVYDSAALDDPERAYDLVAAALAAYERSSELNPFSSKYDAYLAGTATLTPRELRGLKLFEAEDKGNCAACHPSSSDTGPPLFTDFTYDNLGVPRNPDSPFHTQAKQFNPDGEAFADQGLGSVAGAAAENGKFKVSTLRNIALTAPYMHNGVFKDLREVVEFYNSRDLDPKWPAPEVTENVNTEEMGDLGLSRAEVDDIVAFLETLSDGYGAARE